MTSNDTNGDAERANDDGIVTRIKRVFKRN